LKDILVDLMNDKFIYVGIRALLNGGLQASPSTIRHSGPAAEKQQKHHHDLANVKQILSVLSEYILPLTGIVNRDNILHDFEYTLIIAYLSKGIHSVGT
jgi:hypothetical protein